MIDDNLTSNSNKARGPPWYLKALREFMQQDSEFEKWIERYIDDADVLVFTDIPDIFKMSEIRMVNNQ